MPRSQRHQQQIQFRNSQDQRNPVASVAPTLTGTTTNGSTLTGNVGTWTHTGPGAVTLTRQYLREWLPIPGANNATYVLTAADVGSRMRLQVVALGGAVNGSRTVTTSAATAVVT